MAIIELITGLAWPTVVAAPAVYFRDEIRNLLRRVSKIGLDGAEFGTSMGQLSAPISRDIDFQNLAALGFDGTPVIETVERKLLQQVSLVQEDKRIPFLSRLLAQAQIELFFERTDAFIYGSQIDLLRLIQSAGGRISVSDAEAFFQEAKSKTGSYYDRAEFPDWFSFLMRSELALQDHKTIELTPVGREFISYLNSRGLPNKAF